MLSRLARLRGSALRRSALGRAIVVLGIATTFSIASMEGIDPASAGSDNQKPFNQMNLKLYAYNQMSWPDFECYNQLIRKESSWNPKARNGSHYGLGQMRSVWYSRLDPFRQIDAHINYINHRYKGKPCLALKHLERYGWH
jgi:hypothetical protein